MLAIEGLTKAFGKSVAVSDLSLSIPRGQFVGVIGRSGAGKSPFLRMLNRLVDPSGGRILWDGEDVSALRGRALRSWRPWRSRSPWPPTQTAPNPGYRR